MQKSERRTDGSLRVYTVNNEPSLTQQQFKDSANINNIMKRYASTGQFTHLSNKIGQYSDLSTITDYHSMVNQVVRAESTFMDLPADIRKKFRNDPGELITFLGDPTNYDEALKLGLVNKKEDSASLNDDKTTKSAPTS